jgi:hypothetical protein
MADEKIVDDVIEDDQESGGKGNAEEEKVTLEEAYRIARATQKGYTQQQQALQSVQENLQAIADKMNTQSGAEKGDDEYVTVGKLRAELAAYDSAKEQRVATEAQQRQQEADDIVETQLDRLEELGAIKNSDRSSLCQYALDNQLMDLREAYIGWSKLTSDEKSKQSQAQSKQERKEASSKVGTSSKNSPPEGKIPWEEIVAQRGSF